MPTRDEVTACEPRPHFDKRISYRLRVCVCVCAFWHTGCFTQLRTRLDSLDYLVLSSRKYSFQRLPLFDGRMYSVSAWLDSKKQSLPYII